MPINNTPDAQNKTAAAEFAEKMKLESRMTPDLRRFFKRMANDLEASVLLTGGVQPTQKYEKSLGAIILGQYQRVETKFAHRHTDQLEEEPEDSNIWLVLLAIGSLIGLSGKDEVLVYLKNQTSVNIDEFIDVNVPKDTGNITRTNDRHLQAAVATAGVTLTETLGREPTNPELAKESKKQFLKHDLPRTNTIAATTTQKAAEGMKNINRETFLDLRNGMESVRLQIPQNKGGEVWASLGDNIVRTAHLRADGQIKQNGTFTVMGQLLKFPGDDSLGATLDNIINCRCSSIFTFEEDGSIPEFFLEPLL